MYAFLSGDVVVRFALCSINMRPYIIERESTTYYYVVIITFFRYELEK